jgi:hypothetical protein
MTLQGGAGAERHDGHAVRGGDAHDGGRLVDRPRPHDDVRRRGGVKGLIAAMLGQLVGAGADPVAAQQIAQRVAGRVQCRGLGPGEDGHLGRGHGNSVTLTRRPRQA